MLIFVITGKDREHFMIDEGKGFLVYRIGFQPREELFF